MQKEYKPDSDFTKKLFNDIRTFIKRGTDQKDTEKEFNELSLRLFEYQYNSIESYNKYCKKRGVKPGDIDDWKDIPYVAANAFKEVPLCSFPPDQAVKVFMSSGTTDPQKRTKIYLNQAGLDMYDLSMRQSTESYTYSSPEEKFHMLLFFPSPESLPQASGMLYTPMKIIEGHYLERHFCITPQGIDFDFIVERLRKAESDGEPIGVQGATFGIVHFFDYCIAKNLTFKLPAGSRVSGGAGFKGRSRELTKDEFFDTAIRLTGVEPHMIMDQYALSEVQAIFPDNVLYNHLKDIKEPRYKVNAPWTKTVVVDPDTLDPLPEGKQGLLRHYCLANIVTPQVVQSDDIGYAIGLGFEVVGRAKGAEARGCSIAVDEMISAQKA